MVAIKKFIRVNERIRVPEVRLVGNDGSQLGVVAIQKALELADQSELDLIEVAPNANPPVCRIGDFSKFKYDQEKKEREDKKHQAHGKLKEIRIKPNITEHDYQVKLRQTLGFLKKKDKVKVTLVFRGRQMEHVDLGRRILDKFISDTQNAGQIEKTPVQEGRSIYMVIGP